MTKQSLSLELNKNDFENAVLPHGVQVHTLILLYNQLIKQTKESGKEQILKEQIAAIMQPKTSALANHSKEAVMTTTKEFLEIFKKEDIAHESD